MAEFEYGVTCITAVVNNSKQVTLKFVINKKQYKVVYKERKTRYDDRNLAKLLTVGEALKASAWNVPSGPPGSNKISWYVTDVWTPKIAGMEKKRIPEPTFSVVCKVIYKLGKAFLICEIGKSFPKDVIVLPRSSIKRIPENAQPEIGDYLLASILLMWEQQGNEEKAKLIPIWAHWDRSNCTENSTAHLNAIEIGPENETLVVHDQIPCMWGVVQNVYKESFQAYVPCSGYSVSVRYTAVHQYVSSMHILEGDWVQLWLKPVSTAQPCISEVHTWSCSHCCWFGPRSRKMYESCLQQRLTTRYHRHGVLTADDGKKTEPNPAQAQNNVKSSVDIVGKGKVTQVKDKSAFMKCGGKICKKDHVIHLGLFTVYGIKVSSINKLRMKDLVEQGSEIHYRMNASTKNVRSVWIGPEVVDFKSLNFMPQLITWMKKRNLDGDIIRDMMKEMSDRTDAQKNAKSTDSKVATQTSLKKNAPKGEKVESDINQTLEMVSSHSTDINQLNVALESFGLTGNKGMTMDEAVSLEIAGNSEGQPLDDVSEASYCYSKEEEEELEKVWWSDDSDEDSDAELRPVLNIPPLDDPPNARVLAEDFQVTQSSAGVPFNSNEESGQDNKSENGLSESHSVGDGMDAEYELASASSGISDVKSSVSLPNSAKSGKSTLRGSNKITDSKSMGDNTKSASCLLVMTELTKFLLLKGKVSSVAEAGELSANFVCHLESVVEESSPPSTATESVGTQTEISGPIKPYYEL